jgi:hypothetical protein
MMPYDGKLYLLEQAILDEIRLRRHCHDILLIFDLPRLLMQRRDVFCIWP